LRHKSWPWKQSINRTHSTMIIWSSTMLWIYKQPWKLTSMEPTSRKRM
jgi:hypothetical protein